MKPLLLDPQWSQATSPYYLLFQELRAYRRLIMKIRTKEPLSQALREFVYTSFLPTIIPAPQLYLHTDIIDAQKAYQQFEELYLKEKYPNADSLNCLKYVLQNHKLTEEKKNGKF